MTTYPEDSVLHRHMQSALQFAEVSIPDIPTDSVLHRHAADMPQSTSSVASEPVETKVAAVTEPLASKAPDQSPQEDTPPPVVAQSEQPASGGLFAWLKKLLGG